MPQSQTAALPRHQEEEETDKSKQAKLASGPRVKFASRKSALNPPVVYSTDRSKAVVPVLVLLFVGLWFILRGNLFYVLPCVILFLFFFFSPFSIAITSLGEERANLSAFRTFV